MENEGLPTFIAIIVGAVLLGAMVIAGVVLHAILTM
jgi:hypothetical protein